MLNCNQFSMWRKNTDEKEKERREKAIKFGRELRLTATRSEENITDRSHSTLISAREGKRLLPLCASGTRERRF